MSSVPGTRTSAPSTEQIRAAWDAIAGGYDRFTTPFNLEVAGRLLDRVEIRPGLRILDVACGSGALAITAARRGAHVVAVDLAPAMIERLEARADRERPLDLQGRVMDGQALDLDDDTFDVTVSMNGVSLFPDVTAGLREIERVTRPGGRVLLAAFGALEQAELFTFFTGALRVAVPDIPPWMPDRSSPPLQLTDRASFRSRLEEAGLTDVQVDPFTWAMRFDSVERFWDVVTHSNPVGARLASGLTTRQVGDVKQVLDGMFRERSGGTPGVVLHTAVNVGSALVGRGTRT